MKTKIFLIFSILFMVGCTTVEFVRKDFTPKRQAVLRYNPPSSPARETEYREEVKKEATEFCGGPFEITKEYQARDETGRTGGVGTGIGVGMGAVMFGGTSRETAMYNFVEFSCK